MKKNNDMQNLINEISIEICFVLFCLAYYSRLRIVARFAVTRKSVQLSRVCNYPEGNTLSFFFNK